nr:cytidine deaminase 1-like [Tanacetum cinerariifolium]
MTKPTPTPTPTYILSSSQAQSLAKSQNKTLPDLLPSLVPQAQDLARPPISNFHVGTVGLSSDGRVFFGANIEFPEALAAARGSHAPYSGCPSGVALMDCDGNVYKGMYMESAAYNPSMMPVQAALVAYMVGGGGGYDRIVAAVLVEKEGAMVSQEETARLLLKHISPKYISRM